MNRREFNKATMRDAFLRCNGICEGENCGAKLAHGDFHYDHIIPDALGGEPTLDNCQVLCRACHKEKTGKQDIPRIAKTKRIRDREKGIRKPRTMTRWRRFDGSVVFAERSR
jgi:5-methylcytosine-specific restriction endonuclease McrA